ncbi:MAG: TIGR04086 family membrane protein [Bacillota bacterium]
MAFKTPSTTHSSFSFSAVFRGILTALAIIIIGALFLGIVYHFTGIADSSMPVTSSILLFVGVFLGGFLSSKQSGTKGLFHGLGVGILVFVLIWLLMGIFLTAGVAFVPLIQKFFICVVAGSLGGIVGVGF